MVTVLLRELSPGQFYRFNGEIFLTTTRRTVSKHYSVKVTTGEEYEYHPELCDSQVELLTFVI